MAHRQAGRRTTYQDVVSVTERQGWTVTSVGACLSRRHLRDSWTGYGVCSQAAQDALCAAWQLTIIDQEWDRDDRLWPMLAELSEVTR